ncbi:DUF397 domain-containing protein [Streptomyces sp. NPDC026672]|uniref:DUF397 domain-containing protein n=1 Tax=unclassified Streptomyces TaxID=2593676 RepID=UPI0033CF191A
MERKWRKSSYSSDQGGQCVECAPLGGPTWNTTTCTAMAVRDSKVPNGPVLTLTPAVFKTFVEWARTC